MLGMLVSLLAIVCGLLLLADFFAGVKGFDRAVRALRPFTTAFGVAALVVGILSLFSALGIVLILAGLILASGAVGTIPRVGASIRRAGRALAGARVVIGILALVIGIMQLIE